MRHTDHDFLYALDTCGLNQLVHAGNKGFTTFEREAFLADVFGVQKTLKPLGRGDALQDMALFVGAKTGFAARRFQLLLPPAFFVLVGNVHVLGTNRAAVGFTQCIEQLAQTHGFFTEESVAGVKDDFLVGVVKAVKGRV